MYVTYYMLFHIWNTCIYNLRIVNDLYDACNNQCVFIMIPVCQLTRYGTRKPYGGHLTRNWWNVVLAIDHLRWPRLIYSPLHYFTYKMAIRPKDHEAVLDLSLILYTVLLSLIENIKKWHAVKIVSVNDNLSYEWLTFGLKSKNASWS